MITKCLLLLSIFVVVRSFKYNRIKGISLKFSIVNLDTKTCSKVLPPSFSKLSGYYQDSGVDELIETPTSDDIRKWFLRNHNRRPEVYISKATSKLSVMTDAWKAVLISLRVLESDRNVRDHTTVFAFPDLKVSGNHESIIADFSIIADIIEKDLNQSVALFQPSFARRVEFYVQPSSAGKGYILEINTP